LNFVAAVAIHDFLEFALPANLLKERRNEVFGQIFPIILLEQEFDKLLLDLSM